MILTALEVSGFGRFDTPHRLVGLGPGLNVLAAPNESGKSTLLKALRVAVLEKHTATKTELLALGTRESLLPMRVVAGFTAHGEPFRLTKQFDRQKRAELMRGGRLVASGTEADETLWSVFGLKPHQGRRDLDPAALGALWVAQGESHQAPPIDDPLRADLMAAIRAEAGEIGGSAAARAVARELKALVDRNQTREGRLKKGGALETALTRVQQLEAEVADLEARVAACEPVREALAAARERQARLDDPAEQDGLQDQIARAQAALASARAAASALERLRERAAAAAMAQQLAQREVEALEARIATLLRLETARADAARAAGEQQEALDAALAAERQAAARAGSARAAEDNARTVLRQLEAAASLARARTELAEAEERLVAARTRAAALADARTRQRESAPALSALPELERLEAALMQARARLEAASPRLSVRRLAPEGPPVRLDGEALAGDLDAVPLAGPHVVEVDGLVRIELAPPPGGSDDAGAVAELERALTELLARLGATSGIVLRRMAEDAREAAARLKALEPAAGSAPPPGEAEAAARTDEARRELEAALAAAGDAADQAPDGTTLAAARLALERAQAEAGSAAALAARATEALAGARRAVEAALQRQAASRLALEQAVAGADRSALEQALAAAQDRLAAARAAATDAGAALEQAAAEHAGSADALTLEGRLERLSGALDRLATDRAEAVAEVIRLEARLAAAGDQGLDEASARAREQLDSARQRYRHERDAHLADRLLLHLVQAGLSEGEERMTAPLRAAVQPYLDLLFRDAAVEVAPGLELTGLIRHAAEPFAQLSMGTREQVAVLVRLALADLIHSPAGPLPVILDDALTFTDAGRLQPMFDALHRAARTRQVIVLTCHEALARALGGTRLRLEHVPSGA